MTKQREPMKIDPAEWRSDSKLRSCSLAARGLWVEMMCVMHEAEPYGHLTLDGRPMTPMELCQQVRWMPLREITDLLGELERAGIFARTAEGAIYSPRMVRDEKKRRIARRNGMAGGNPKLGKSERNSASDNRSDAAPQAGR